MKKFVALLLALVMTLALGACGSASTAPDAAGSTAAEETKKEPEKKADAAYTMEETVIVDNDLCAFTVTGVEESDTAVKVSVVCENKSDAVLMFAWEDVAVNGCMIDPFWASSVASGKKDVETISFSKSELGEYGLTAVDEVQFDLYIYDYDDIMTDRIVDERFAIYPTGLTADTVSYPEYAVSDSDTVIFDNDYGTFIITGVDEDALWGYTMQAYILNKTDSAVTCAWDDVSVNGFMCDPYWATTIAGNSRSLVEISFSDSQLEELGIDTVEEIEFRVHLYDDAHWDSYFVDDVFTYAP